MEHIEDKILLDLMAKAIKTCNELYITLKLSNLLNTQESLDFLDKLNEISIRN